MRKYGPRDVAQRWTSKLSAAGWTPISDIFLKHYAEMDPPITTPEAMVIIQLMVNKWDASPPYPGFKGIAKRMGMTDTAVRTHVRRLEKKEYLKRIPRPGNTNEFVLEPLFSALEEFITQEGQMSIERRERPRCRSVINRLLREKGGTLHDLIEGDNKYKISEAMRIQVRKMIDEEAGKKTPA